MTAAFSSATAIWLAASAIAGGDIAALDHAAKAS